MSNSFIIFLAENYKDNYNYENTTSLLVNYFNMINEFICHITRILPRPDKKTNLFIINRGLEGINSIFNILYMYTKNSDLTIYHCKKCSLYYVEFIGQIGEDIHSYLQLNSKDALLFILKKSIFEINENKREKFVINDKDNKYLENIDKITHVYNKLLIYILNLDEENLIIDKTNIILKNISKIMNSIIKNYGKKSINIILYFINSIMQFEPTEYRIIELINIFIKKTRKKSIDFDKLKNNMKLTNLKIFNSTTSLKFINWLISNEC